MSKYAVVDPATGETIRKYDTASDQQIAKAVEVADQAHSQWSRSTTVAQRAELLRNVARLHRERREELATWVQREMGKTVEEALGEIDFSAAIYEYYADNAEKFLADEPIELLAGSGNALIRRSSVGVVLGIMPWNYPYYQVARFVGPNLAVGNTVLLKHAAQCPWTAEALQQIFVDVGFPEGAYTNLFATSDQLAGVIAHPHVQGVSLTGSEAAGAAVAEVAGRNLTKVVLELGGSDPFLVLDSTNLLATVDAAYSARFSNAGQACNAAKRFIVLEDVYDEFLAGLIGRIEADGAGVAPLSSLGAADYLGAQVDRAVSDGATVARTGPRNGAHFPCTVLTDLNPAAASSQEEFFGPVALVFSVPDEASAIELANGSPFGLGSYIFGSDPAQVDRVADQIEAGMVFVNLVGADGAELPFGGIKQSGFGRELGRFGMDEFVNKKLIRTR
ncbi:aldehyde dehydrogenase family protein [Rhodococcus sp. NPDC057014]|uniref:aldehyde dehydrogenase family protein n=1 Tax=Rhodococcus sp. NPDC057014 TaxID=3346000 RepID=UPI0036452787